MLYCFGGIGLSRCCELCLKVEVDVEVEKK